VEQRAGTKGNADQQSTRRAQDRESVSQALGRIRKSSPSNTRGKSRMHKGARTDLCGGRGVTRVPTATAIEIEGEHYWDGGLVSNTPLQWVVESEPRRDILAFQVDLWSARGDFPLSMPDVITREKEIRYSSRTRAGTDQFKHIQKLRRAAAALLEKLPADLKNSPEARLLSAAADRKVFNIVHLIYNARNYEGHSKDYEFSRASMEEHWRAGYHDARRTLRHPEVLEQPSDLEGLFTFDLVQDSRE
jgi:NTE family protein